MSLGTYTRGSSPIERCGGLGRPIGVPTPSRRSNPKNWNFWTSAPQKNTEISPLFKCDSATRAFYGLKDGKITVNFSGWEQNRVVLEGGLWGEMGFLSTRARLSAPLGIGLLSPWFDCEALNVTCPRA